MVLELQQGLKNQQQLSMTPQLRQAIKILQLSSLDLQDFLAQQVIENPMLTNEEEDSNLSDIPSEDSYNYKTNYTSDNYNYQTKSASVTKQNSFAETSQNSYENFLCYENTLKDFLRSQLSIRSIDSEIKKISLLLIDSINERGYLDCSLTEIAQQERISVKSVENALKIIQTFEPIGIGARTIAECLLIQIYFHKLENGIVEKIAEDFLHLASVKKEAFLARELNVNKETILENLKIIARLNFFPGSQFNKKRTDYIIPDLTIRKVNEEWQVSLEKNYNHSVRLNPYYQNLSTNSLSKEEKKYFKDKTQEACWLLKSLEQREKTLLKVMMAIVKHQSSFFDFGPQHFKPLILKDIALETNLHESTISRCTSNKFVNTPRGTFELKFFFSSSIKSDTGSDIANEAIKFELKNIIKEEDKNRPLTDQKIANIFAEKGIQISRRTITKYREQLNIPPSPRRRILR